MAYLKSKKELKFCIIGSNVTAMWWRIAMVGYCLVVEFLWGGSATNDYLVQFHLVYLLPLVQLILFLLVCCIRYRVQRAQKVYKVYKVNRAQREQSEQSIQVNRANRAYFLKFSDNKVKYLLEQEQNKQTLENVRICTNYVTLKYAHGGMHLLKHKGKYRSLLLKVHRSRKICVLSIYL